MKLYIKLIILGISILVLGVLLKYRFESFRDPQQDDDPTCPQGRYSTKTGGVCTGKSSDKAYNIKAETALGANGERHNVGNYDLNPNDPDEDDYRDTDVLRKPGGISYPDWLNDPETNGALYDDTEYYGEDDEMYYSSPISRELRKRQDEAPYRSSCDRY
jgi:hypothetical protein